MSLRPITQITIHLQSFRNIQLWYQGIYYLTIQIFYKQPLAARMSSTNTNTQNNKLINAHPFAHTQNFHLNQQSQRFYDHQIYHPSFITDSKFVSKSFVVKYYEQEIQINDICHFRVQTQLSDYYDPQMYMEVSLMFIDLQQKKSMDKMNKQQIQNVYKNQAKCAKTKKYHIFNANSGVSQFIPLLYDQNFFSLINMTIHSICLDFRFRVNDLQLSQFSKLTYKQKLQLIQSNKLLQKQHKKISYYKSIVNSLKLTNNNNNSNIKQIENLLINQMNNNYNTLLKRYRLLYGKIINDQQRKIFWEKLIKPEELELFQNTKNINNSNNNINMPYQYNNHFQHLNINNKYSNNNNTLNPQEQVQKILNQTNLLASQIFKLWNCYLDIFRVSPRYAVAYLQNQYHAKKKQFWNKMILMRKIVQPNIFMSTNNISSGYNQDNITNVSNMQKKFLQEKLKVRLNTKVQEDFFVMKRQQCPVLFYNIYYKQESNNIKNNIEIINEQQRQKVLQQHRIKQRQQQKISIKKVPSHKGDLDHQYNNYVNSVDEGIHLIVFVHGFQGNSYDMRLIKNYVSFLYPQSMFLCATANQQLTDTDIMEMGVRLATQVKNFIKQNLVGDTLGKLSFIGHSLGGVKIRAALKHLLEYKDKFQCFMTLSSPHLGYKINSSSVVGAGMWVLQKMKNSICLSQLSMTDNINPEQTCLYKISLFQGVEHFKHIFLFSSKQDSYAPFQSARIQVKPQFLNDQSKQIHVQMVKNILKNVKSGVLRRINVLFQIGEKNLDSLIGRTAHIKFLESQQLIKAILYTEPYLLS